MPYQRYGENVHHPEGQPIYMRGIELNNPSVSGYSAACGDYCAISMHTHRKGDEKSVVSWSKDHDGMDVEYNRNTTWHYMPIDDGDFITEIRGRLGPRPYLRGLMVKTPFCDLSFSCHEETFADV